MSAGGFCIDYGKRQVIPSNFDVTTIFNYKYSLVNFCKKKYNF